MTHRYFWSSTSQAMFSLFLRTKNNLEELIRYYQEIIGLNGELSRNVTDAGLFRIFFTSNNLGDRNFIFI